MKSLVLTLCVCLAAVSAFAQAPVRYRLERVIVEGAPTLDEDTIRAETRLEEEQTYTEEDFRQGVYRVRRLPFVTDAAYRIEPGVTGGGTTLVIRILPETMVFYGVNFGASEVADGDVETTGNALLGGRWMLDNLGILEGAVQYSEDEDGYLAGLAYRAYNIYGTGGYASLAVAQRFQAEPYYFDPTAVLNLGYPLTQKQTLTLSYSRAKQRLPRDFDVEGDDDDPDVDEDEAEDDNHTLTDRDRFEFAELRWWYETIDDPIFTRRGVQFSAGPRWSSVERVTEVYDVDNVDPEQEEIATETTVYSVGLAADGAAYKPFTRRNAAFLRFGGDWTKTDEASDATFINGAARIGLTHDFHSPEENVIHPFRARFEIGAGYRTSIFSPPQGDEVQNSNPFAEAAFVMRHRFGTIRLSAFYDAD